MKFDQPLTFQASLIPLKIGETIAAERKLLGWTQQRLANEAGLKRETIVRLELGSRRPTGDTVFRLEAALQLEPGTLVPEWPEWRPIGAMTHGARSRHRRRELNLPLTTVAEAAGVCIATLSRFEREIGACRELANYDRVEGMPEVIGLRSTSYAKVLGFASVEEHECYCLGSV